MLASLGDLNASICRSTAKMRYLLKVCVKVDAQLS
jgi:hypothetical protein